jgi:hypothetical protein
MDVRAVVVVESREGVGTSGGVLVWGEGAWAVRPKVNVAASASEACVMVGSVGSGLMGCGVRGRGTGAAPFGGRING